MGQQASVTDSALETAIAKFERNMANAVTPRLRHGLSKFAADLVLGGFPAPLKLTVAWDKEPKPSKIKTGNIVWQDWPDIVVTPIELDYEYSLNWKSRPTSREELHNRREPRRLKITLSALPASYPIQLTLKYHFLHPMPLPSRFLTSFGVTEFDDTSLRLQLAEVLKLKIMEASYRRPDECRKRSRFLSARIG
jgi:hypothetical protein